MRLNDLVEIRKLLAEHGKRLDALEQQLAQFGFTNKDGQEVPPLPRPHPPADLRPMDCFEESGS